MSPTVGIRGWQVSAFRLCGVVGFVSACAVATAVTRAHGASVVVQAALVALAVAVFFGLALLTRRLLGREALIYYHHEIAVLCTTASLAALAGAPVLAHLDATALGLGAFLAWGRIGCLRVGCCHGRPARRGVVYGPEHRVPGYLTGVRLVPVQAVEAAAAATLSALGVVLVLTGSPAGSAALAYVTGYAVIRFALERLRGDILRPHWRGLSEAQWTSLVLCAAVCALGALGALPASGWHLAALTVLALAAGAAVTGLVKPPADPLAACHVRELAGRLATLPDTAPVHATRTSAGVCLSRGETGGTVHYGLSRRGARLSSAEAAQLARVVLWLEHPGATGRLLPGVAGVRHLLVADALTPEVPDAGSTGGRNASERFSPAGRYPTAPRSS